MQNQIRSYQYLPVSNKDFNVLHYIFCPQIIYRIELHHSVIGVAVMNDFVKNEQRLAHDIMQVLRDNSKA